MFEIRRYTDNDRKAWDRFVDASRQGTFLFRRGYMDYHRDRFADHSMLILRRGSLFALLPANVDGDTLWSHQGLTYGGLLTDHRATAADVIDIFEQLNQSLHDEGLRHVVYKPMPWIYQRQPSEEDLYALTQTCHARLSARNLSSAINLRQPLHWRYGRTYDANKAEAGGITIEEDSSRLTDFWSVLEQNLDDNHHAHPVHSLSEMQLLQSRFPDSIRLYVALLDGELLGGTLLYVTPQVVHTQYISASPEGKRLHALDLLFRHVLKAFPDRAYFDFGTSNGDQGRWLDRGLIFQKEGFGGRGVCYDSYEYDV